MATYTNNTPRRKKIFPTVNTHFDGIRDTDILAMLSERHGITEPDHVRLALAIAGHEVAHYGAAVACGVGRGAIRLNLRENPRRVTSAMNAWVGPSRERNAFATLVGASWERVYIDGSEQAAGSDIQQGRQLAATQWPAILAITDEFVEQYADLFFWGGVYLLAHVPKLGGRVADSHARRLTDWLRPQLQLPALPTVTDQNIRDYAHTEPQARTLPPPVRPLRPFTPPIYPDAPADNLAPSEGQVTPATPETPTAPLDPILHWWFYERDPEDAES
jgi:hypothetical protein